MWGAQRKFRSKAQDGGPAPLPAVRVTAEDIALANGAVTVGRARVDGARLTLEERTATPMRTWELRDLAADGDMIICMGAGDIQRVSLNLKQP